jgi:hypothetical protein
MIVWSGFGIFVAILGFGSCLLASGLERYHQRAPRLSGRLHSEVLDDMLMPNRPYPQPSTKQIL